MWQVEGPRTGVRTRIKPGSERSGCSSRHHSCWTPLRFFKDPKKVRSKDGSCRNEGGTSADACGVGNSDGNCGTVVVESLSLSNLCRLEIAYSKSGKVRIVIDDIGYRGGVYSSTTEDTMVEGVDTDIRRGGGTFKDSRK